MKFVIMFLPLFLFVAQCNKENENIKEIKNEIKLQEISKVPSDTFWGDSLVGYYSNKEMDTVQSLDCAGYTISFFKDSIHNLSAFFNTYDGNCNGKGNKIDSIIYLKENDSLFFCIPFDSSIFKSPIQFHGKIFKSKLYGNLKYYYPNSKKEESEEINLKKIT